MTSFDFLYHIDRRTFLRIISLTGMTGLIYPRTLLSSLVSNTLSRVVIVTESTATTGTSINSNAVQIMIDSGIKNLAQQDSVGEAWKALLPGISQTKTIALKVNCINSSMPTHPVVTLAVVSGLKKMNFGGTLFPENKIIIFDRTSWELQSSGYTLNTSGSGVRCFGTNSSGVGNSSQSYSVAGKTQKISKIVTDLADYLINISVLKNHGTSGVTLCLKNHYGTCNDPGALHDNYANPYIPALNALTPIQTKQKINICDALFGVKSGGPSGSPQFAANKIIMSTDIVAVDYWGRKILQENGCSTTSYAHHIDTAATTYHLGTNDPSQMEVINITNPTTDVAAPHSESDFSVDFRLEQNYPNPFNHQTRIKFYVPKSAEVQLSIFDTTGRQVRSLMSRNLNVGWHEADWDGASEAGDLVASGVYLCQLKTGNFQKSIIMQLIK